MEDKYYAPKTEEFHVGFEFEETPFIGDYKLTSNPIWHKVIYQITEKAPLSTIESMIHFKHARVKYLDRSDIESFGFKFDATRSKVDGNFVGSYENEKYYLDYSPYSYSGEFNSSVHLRVMKIKDIPITSYQSNYQFIYDGIIKNKSELKKLLIQLEIINE